MKAAVCYEYGKPLVIEDIKIDPPAKGQVKVRMAATAICHSDIHALKGELPAPLPMIAGHESSGYIEEVGEGVTHVKKGDPVVLSLIASCGECLYCRTDRPHICETELSIAKNTPLSNSKGQRIANFLRTATFAEYAIADKSQVVKIPQDMRMDSAALLACGVITGWGSVVNRAQVKPLSSVVVIGVGGVGLNSIQGAAFAGAYPIIAVDVLDSKLKAAMEFGATHTVNAKQQDPIEAVKKLTAGRGSDYTFITVGSCAAFLQGMRMTGKQGMTVQVGLPNFKDTVNFSPMELIGVEKVLTGSMMGSTNLAIDIPGLVALYQAKRLKLDELVTKHYGLDQINEAIDSVIKGEALRNVIMFK
jgi:S-(hydroxymethyl)glutathione dehydrogenase / alcohol dehydrogenase